MNSVIKRIGTHDGVFHCDEVLACFMLRRLPEYSNSEVIRTRNKSILDKCDVVVDVGGVYDPKNHKYDHHQRDFNHTMKTLSPSRIWNIKLSSAGLVFHHFGERILETILGPPQDSEVIKNLFSYVYENLIQEVDGIDNGVPMCEGEPVYRVHTHLSARVAKLNPAWNDNEHYDSQKMFHLAMDLVGKEFMEMIQHFTKIWWPAKELVKEAILNRSSIHESGEIVELKQFCPWIHHLFSIETDLTIRGHIKYVIFQDNSWRVRAVPVEPDSTICRLPLPEAWRGLRGDELSTVSGIRDCVFAHANGFIGGHETREGALRMALKSMEINKEKAKGESV